MARSLPSIRHYIIFLVLTLLTSIISISVYIVSERKIQLIKRSEDQHYFDSFKDSLLLQKLGVAVSVKNFQRKLDLANTARSGPVRLLPSETQQAEGKNMSHLLEGKFKKTLVDKTRDSKMTVSSSNPGTEINFRVHIFYYLWYGSPETDGRYIHWNHHILPHWNKQEAKKWPLGKHFPPDDVGSNFYPELGPYSSANPSTVNMHMKQIRAAGVGVVAVSWYPPGQADSNGIPYDSLLPLILNSAHSQGIEVCFHIEPHENRSGETLNLHIKYIIDTYGHHPGFYRTQIKGQNLPIFYIYDSYQVPSSEWAAALKPGTALSLRSTKYDGVFLGLYISSENEKDIVDSGFDGIYTYFAAKGFTKGSSWDNWNSIGEFAKLNNLLFVPSVGPGYVDTRIRPWNGQTERKRENGNYFKQAFQAAIDAGVDYISITSFNEWHEGTQVEPAVPKETESFRYEDYQPNQPDFYLQLLKTLVDQFSQGQQ